MTKSSLPAQQIREGVAGHFQLTFTPGANLSAGQLGRFVETLEELWTDAADDDSARIRIVSVEAGSLLVGGLLMGALSWAAKNPEKVEAWAKLIGKAFKVAARKAPVLQRRIENWLSQLDLTTNVRKLAHEIQTHPVGTEIRIAVTPEGYKTTVLNYPTRLRAIQIKTVSAAANVARTNEPQIKKPAPKRTAVVSGNKPSEPKPGS